MKLVRQLAVQPCELGMQTFIPGDGFVREGETWHETALLEANGVIISGDELVGGGETWYETSPQMLPPVDVR